MNNKQFQLLRSASYFQLSHKVSIPTHIRSTFSWLHGSVAGPVSHFVFWWIVNNDLQHVLTNPAISTKIINYWAQTQRQNTQNMRTSRFSCYYDTVDTRQLRKVSIYPVKTYHAWLQRQGYLNNIFIKLLLFIIITMIITRVLWVYCLRERMLEKYTIHSYSVWVE